MRVIIKFTAGQLIVAFAVHVVFTVNFIQAMHLFIISNG